VGIAGPPPDGQFKLLHLWAAKCPQAGRSDYCLAKGKARKPYEFGVKVSITTTHKEGLVVGMRSMPGNPYDGHTLAEALEQTAILCDATPEVAIVDRGYKGVAVDGVKIYHPGLRRGITRGLRAMIRRRSAIEPAIGHMKTDGKLDRNWLKGALGDAMHAVLCVRRSQPADDPEEAAASLRLYSGCLVQPQRCRRRDGVTPAT
jgi:IS5 family transposase